MAATKKLTTKEVLKGGSEILAEAVLKGIQEKKGREITMLDLRSLKNAVADFFVICHGDSNTHVSAIARSVEEITHLETGEDPVYREGFENMEWILLDYITVVVHIFQKEQRDFYGIERFWADAEIRKIA